MKTCMCALRSEYSNEKNSTEGAPIQMCTCPSGFSVPEISDSRWLSSAFSVEKARLVWPGRALRATKKIQAPGIGTWDQIVYATSTDETNRAGPGEAATRLGGRVSTRTGP